MPYSYGDSAGLEPASLFIPVFIAGNQLNDKYSVQLIAESLLLMLNSFSYYLQSHDSKAKARSF